MIERLVSTPARFPILAATESWFRVIVHATYPVPLDKNGYHHEARPYSSFALIVIFAFSTFDTGHPFSAASANF